MPDGFDPLIEFDKLPYDSWEGHKVVLEAEEIAYKAAFEEPKKPSMLRRLGRVLLDGLSQGGPWLYLGGGVYIPPQNFGDPSNPEDRL